MSENLRKELGIDEWLELVKEDKNFDSAYISFAQYMYTLEKENQHLKKQLKQRNEVIDESIKQTKFIDEQLRKYVTPIPSKEVTDLLEILQKYKGEKDDNK